MKKLLSFICMFIFVFCFVRDVQYYTIDNNIRCQKIVLETFGRRPHRYIKEQRMNMKNRDEFALFKGDAVDFDETTGKIDFFMGEIYCNSAT